MNKRNFLYKVGSFLLLSSLLLTSCKDDLMSDVDTGLKQEEQVKVKVQEENPYFEGMAYIKFKDGQQPKEGFRAIRSASTMLAKSDVKLKPIFDLESPKGQAMWGEWAEAIKREGLDRWYEVEFDKESDVKEVAKELLTSEVVEVATPVVKLAPVQPFYTPYSGEQLRADVASAVNGGYGYSDPLLKVQWHYQNNSGYALDDFVKGADINLFKAWDITKGRKEVVVAIIDSGIDLEHPDLKASIWTGKQGEHGHDFVDDNRSIEAGYHGTHVAGTVAARNNNGEGGGGVAGGDGTEDSGVRLMSCQVFGEDDAYGHAKSGKPADFMKAFVWAANHGAVVANCSWGFSATGYNDNELYTEAKKDDFKVMKGGIDYFIKNAGHRPDGSPDPEAEMEGGVVLVASGNDGKKDIDVMPAFYDKVIAVGSFTSTFQLAKYTNTGDWVDILAPGGITPLGSDMNGGILSTVPASFESMWFGKPDQGGFDAKQFVYPGYTRYAYAQGTSMATPHVTGIAALMVSHFGGKGRGFKADELRKRLLAAVKAKDHEDVNPKFRGKIGVGYIDAARALDAKIETLAPQEALNLNVKELEYYDARIKWQVSEDEDAYTKVAYAYDIYIQQGNKVSASTPLFTTVYTGDKALGAWLDCGFGKLQSNTEYTVVLIARDSYGNKSGKVQLSFKTKENKLPKIVNFPKNGILISENEPFYRYSFKVEDEDKGQTWEFITPALPKGVSVTRKGEHLELLIDVLGQGNFSFDIELKDNLGGVKIEEIRYSIIPQKEQVIKEQEFTLAIKKNKSIKLTELFSTSEESLKGLTLALSSNDKAVAMAQSAENAVLIKPVGKGSATIVAELRDKDGAVQFKALLQVNVTGKDQPAVEAIYPSVAHSFLKVLCAEGVKQVVVKVTSPRGELLIEKTLSVDASTREAMLGVDKLVPGVYNLIIKTNDATVKHSFIKN